MKYNIKKKALTIAIVNIILLSTVTIPTQSVSLNPDERRSSGLFFDDNMKYYKPSETPITAIEEEGLNNYLFKLDAMKQGGQWNLSGDEFTFSSEQANRNRKGGRMKASDYKTKQGGETDPSFWSDSINPQYINKGGNKLGMYLAQPMSDRTRLMLMAASSMIGWDYSHTDRLTLNSGKTDCSGLVAQAARAAGIKGPTTGTKNYPGEPTIREISFDQLEPGDLLWKNGHVEIYLGKAANGKHGRLGSRTSRFKEWKGVQIKEDFDPKRPAPYTKAYRLKGKDIPLRQSEMEKLGYM